MVKGIKGSGPRRFFPGLRHSKVKKVKPRRGIFAGTNSDLIVAPELDLVNANQVTLYSLVQQTLGRTNKYYSKNPLES